MRENTSAIRLFCWTYFSLVSAQALVMWLGAALATTIPGSDGFETAFNNAGVGGLMDQSFQGHGSAAYGFGNFVRLILVLSAVAVTIPNLYSLCKTSVCGLSKSLDLSGHQSVSLSSPSLLLLDATISLLSSRTS